MAYRVTLIVDNMRMQLVQKPELYDVLVLPNLAKVIEEGKNVTYDMKRMPDDPTAVGTAEFANAVIEAMERL